MSTVTITEIDPICCQISHPKLVDRVLSYQKEYWRTGLFKKEQGFQTVSLLDHKNRFYSGFIPRIVKYLERRDHIVCVDRIDLYDEYDIVNPFLEGITFRDDQIKSIMAAITHMRGVLLAPTGSGKGLIIPAIISCLPNAKVLFLTHTIDLVKQGVDIFEHYWPGSTSNVFGGKKDLSGRIVCASIQSFSKLDPSVYCGMFDVVFADECFKKGTLVNTPLGATPIEKLNVGDAVFCKTGVSTIKRIFQNKVPVSKTITLRLSNGKHITCTKDHLFYVDGKWVEAQNTKGKTLCTFEGVFVNMMSSTTVQNRRSYEKIKIHLHHLWNRFLHKAHKTRKEAVRQSTLQECTCFSNNEKNKSETFQKNFREDENKQSFLQPQKHFENEGNKTTKWNTSQHSCGSGGEWETSAYSTNDSVKCVGVEDRISHSHITEKRKWLSHFLQGRCGSTRIKNSDRSRWAFPLFQKTFGQKERSFSNSVRVEDVEVYQPRCFEGSSCSPDHSEKCCEESVIFYDLEIENDHSYFVEGVCVHNCHHSATFDTGGFFKIFSNLLTPFRFGLTATLPPKGETQLVLEGMIGPVIDEFTFEEATEKGVLSVPKVQLIKVEPYNNMEVKSYRDIYEQAVVYNRGRNKQIIDAIVACNAKGLSTVTYVQRIDHIDRILSLNSILGTGIEIVPVHGNVDSDVRFDIKKNLNDKKIMNVIATVVWKEGVNIPTLDTIIIAGGGKSEKDLIQSCGRGARKTEDKSEFLIIDFIDSAKYLSQHVCERLGVYIRKGWL